MFQDESPPMFTHEKNMVSFWEEAKESGLASTKAGRAMFDRVLMMRVTAPGMKSDTLYEVEREYPEGYPHPIHGKVHVNADIYRRYQQYVDEFKKRGAQTATNGTPLEQWALMDRRTVMQFKHNGVHNVEGLASLTDVAMSSIPGSRAWAQKAKDWLAQAANSAAAMQAQEQNRHMQTQLDQLREQLATLGEALNALPPDARAQAQDVIKKRGRQQAAA